MVILCYGDIYSMMILRVLAVVVVTCVRLLGVNAALSVTTSAKNTCVMLLNSYNEF